MDFFLEIIGGWIFTLWYCQVDDFFCLLIFVGSARGLGFMCAIFALNPRRSVSQSSLRHTVIQPKSYEKVQESISLRPLCIE